MATVINNPSPRERVVVESDATGWAIAVILLLIAIAGGLYWWLHTRRPAAPAAAPGPSANINVTVPAPGTNDTP